ncbi:hypothetical protein QSE00_19035 [Arenibacter sp. M-2]|uniref:hypothetical protein n=1 Tax=Arenibacter sp. M-2 TaxID=3053612 RepID=UPI00256FB684|nr:hypothetical protein [Arenibacter sp. M-2]MDL5513921.1 hypothetical protein [Arenibacter sp. M-2]|tara:strand:- start:1033 stop:1251 length:219 start_codon:yes stop_codon:yes gene_type:complete
MNQENLKMTKQLKLICLLFTGTVMFGQDFSASQIPSVEVDQFIIDFPKAKDLERELTKEIITSIEKVFLPQL